ncbi:MAG: XRE family transcriptional regulator [Bacteroidales bacterium]|nr:XRE family transcriptional regulator [Anaerotignum sp.]MCI5679742.1 XRE family transcriptional regulator [Bacteroidales bacterium]MDY3927286.1 XRE family transcriptional regulator [Anaerotignum sp.]
MDAMSSMISANLKRIRKEKKLSLDAVAEMTGVSKSMLGQIERGESSPTVATLWKIATGLHISFTALLEGKVEETKFIPGEDLQALLSDEGRFRLYPFFPYDESRRFEMLSIEMEPGSRSESVPHEEGTEEYVLVFEGTMKLTVDGNEYLIHAGDGIRYNASKAHIYENPGSVPSKLCMVICYKK